MSTAFIDKEVHIMGRHRLSPTSSARIEAHAQRGADFHMVTVIDLNVLWRRWLWNRYLEEKTVTKGHDRIFTWQVFSKSNQNHTVSTGSGDDGDLDVQLNVKEEM